MPSNQKTFEENSSDIEDVCDKVEKRQIIEVNSSVASRRPVRRKAKPKNADFEYDLSNLLKMEAQGYRENQTTVNTTKTYQAKKKPQPDVAISYEIINRDCLGAMDTLSRKAVEQAKAEMKTSNFAVYSCSQKERAPNIFIRPMLPKSILKDKSSPKKDTNEDKKDNSNTNKDTKSKSQIVEPALKDGKDETMKVTGSNEVVTTKEQDDVKITNETPKNKTVTSVVPIKFRRQSLDVMKNPLINQNIKDFRKAGMKTKILVIKPIKVKDGAQSANSPLKFQTIKLKDSNRKSIGEEFSDQVVVVKVPNVDRNVVLSVPESMVVATEKPVEIDQAQSHETIDFVTNGDKTNPSTAINNENESIIDKSDKSSDINLLCDEDLLKLDVTSKRIVVKIDNKISSSNELS